MANVDRRLVVAAVVEGELPLLGVLGLGGEHAALHGDDAGDLVLLGFLLLHHDLPIEGEGNEGRRLGGNRLGEALTDEAPLAEHRHRPLLQLRVGGVLEAHRAERVLRVATLALCIIQVNHLAAGVALVDGDHGGAALGHRHGGAGLEVRGADGIAACGGVGLAGGGAGIGAAGWRRGGDFHDADAAVATGLFATADGHDLARVDARSHQLVAHLVGALERGPAFISVVGEREALHHDVLVGAAQVVDGALELPLPLVEVGFGGRASVALVRGRRVGGCGAVALATPRKSPVARARVAGLTGRRTGPPARSPSAVRGGRARRRRRGRRSRHVVARDLLALLLFVAGDGLVLGDGAVVVVTPHPRLPLLHRRPSVVGCGAGGRGLREEIVGAQGLPVDQADPAEVEAEAHGGAAPDAELHLLPILARGVVDDGPGLEVHLAGAEHHAVAGLPGRRFGHVGELHFVGTAAGKRYLHLQRAIGAGARIRDRRGLAGASVGHRERLEKVVDLVGRHAHAQGFAGHRGGALEVRNAVAVDDDAPEGGLALHEGGGRRATAHEEGQGGKDEEGRSHGGPVRRASSAQVSADVKVPLTLFQTPP